MQNVTAPSRISISPADRACPCLASFRHLQLPEPVLRVPRRREHHHGRAPREAHRVSPSAPWPPTRFPHPAAPVASPGLLLPGPAASTGPAASGACPTPSGSCASASRWVPDWAHRLCFPPTRAVWVAGPFPRALLRGLCFTALPRCYFGLFELRGKQLTQLAGTWPAAGLHTVLASDSLLSQGLLPLQS